MKKLLAVVLVFLLATGLTGCIPENYDYSDELSGIREDIQQIEILEVETEKVITETEVVTVEVPVIITETEVVTVYEEIEVKTESEHNTIFISGDGETVIVNSTRGTTSYIWEIIYKDPTFSGPYMMFVQIEKQVDGEVVNAYFFEDYATEEELKVEVEDLDDFLDTINDINEFTFDDVEDLYLSLEDEDNSKELEVGQVIETGEEYNITLSGSNQDYTFVYQADLDGPINVRLDFETTAQIDVNFYNNTIIWYNWETFETFEAGTHTYNYFCQDGGTYYFELENFNEFDVDVTITFTIGETT